LTQEEEKEEEESEESEEEEWSALEGGMKDLNRAHWQRIGLPALVFVFRESKETLEFHQRGANVWEGE